MQSRRWAAPGVFILLLCAGSPAWALSPRVRHLLPHGAQRGTEARLVVQGNNLEDAREVLLYDQGLEVLSLAATDEASRKGQELVLNVRIAADCPLGSQRLRIRTETGLSNLVLFSVGPLPVVEEAETNTSFDQPQAISLDQTVHGRITTEDVDYFAIDARQGERINLEVVGLRLGNGANRGNNFFDPYLAILDERRFELASSDDAPLEHNDPAISFIPPADGRYVVELRDVAYGGDDDSYYLLHVGHFPRPSAIFPLGGKPGANQTIHFFGDAAGDFEQVFVAPPLPGQVAYVEARDDRGVAPTPHPFRVSPLDNAFEQEPNNSIDAATDCAAPGALNGRFEDAGDVDFFRFSGTQGQVFDINVYARQLRSAADTVLTIRDAEGRQLAENDDNRQPDSALRFTVPADGKFLVEIRDHLYGGGPAYGYRVEITPVAPEVAATTVETRRYVQPQFVVPQGGAFGVQMAVTRKDVGGPVSVFSENLPAGVTVECPGEWHGEATMPVVLRAAADAPLAGSWSTFQLACGDPAQPDSIVRGIMSQMVLLVRGQNNDRIWEEEQTRLPVIVTAPPPFRIRLETPQTPVIQGGALPLKVIAERDEGYNEIIRVVVLQNPPGCNSATATEIPAGQSEVLIPLNAAPNAPVRISPIAVRAIASPPGNGEQGQRGRGNRGRGIYETCSNWAPLSVESPYFKLDIQQAVVEQGGETDCLVKVEPLRDFEGEAEITLVGLPANAEAAPRKLTKDQQELTFRVKAAPDTPVGMTKSLLCQVQAPHGDAMVAFSLGSGRLRVDPAPAAQPRADVAAAPAAAPASKPLSRLEQLRQEQAAREAAQSADAPAP